MKKKLTLALVLLLILSLLTACGSSASSDSGSSSSASYNSSAVMEAAYDYGYSYDTVEDAYAASSAPTSSSMPNYGNAKLIYTANISAQTTAFDEAAARMNQLVSSLGGYYESSSVDNYSTYRYGSYTVRVPAESFESFCSAVSELCTLTSISRTAEDVSEYYYDTESRLVTQQTKLARLQELLSKAEDMEDIITLENAISETEWNIENLTGTLRHYDSLVGFSTVYVYLREVYQIEEIEEPVIGFGAKLASALKRGCASFVSSLQSLLLSLAYHWVGWLLFLAVVIAAVLLLRRRARRKREREDEYLRKFTAKKEEKDEEKRE